MPSDRFTYDDALELQSSTTDTSTDSSTPVNFEVRKDGFYAVVLDVTAIDATTGDESYIPSVGVSDATGGTYTAVATLPNIRATGVGRYVIPLHGALVEKLDADADWIKVTLTLSGTTPSITWSAFIGKQ